jgi:transcription-repair coupling factor (superfamily II helicase)
MRRRQGFRRRYRTRFEGDPTQAGIYRGVSEGLAPAGIEFYLPLFFETTATLFDYLPGNAILVRDATLTAALERNWQDIKTRYEQRRHDIERPVLGPQELFLDPGEIETRLESFAAIELNTFKADT